MSAPNTIAPYGGEGRHAVPISLTVSPIKDGAGTIIGASKIARDITDYERAVKSLARG